MSNEITDAFKAVVPTEKIYNDALQPLVKQIGKTLELPIRAINAALSPVEKWILCRENNIEETKQLLAEKLKHVPPERIIAPEPYVAVPALQAISYCMNNIELKELFANLLATAMTEDKKELAHPSFVEIIKQFSPLDAKLLNESKIFDTKYIPSCQVRFQKKSSLKIPFKIENHPFRKGEIGHDILRNFVLFEKPSRNYNEISTSLGNIKRLGLIDIDYRYTLEDFSHYVPFIDHPYIRLLDQSCDSFRTDSKYEEYEIALIRGAIKLTDFGELFYKACIA